MPSTARGRLTNTSVRPPQDSPALPKYEAPSHPLNERAQNALQDLPRNHKLDVLKNRLQAANAHLTEAAADINERLYAKNLSHEKAKKRQEAMSSQASGNIDEDAVDIMRNETESMTGKLDQKMREMIDMRAEVANTESALRELDANAVGNRRGPAQTQSTVEVTQMRTQNRSSTSDEDEDEEADGTSSQPGTLVDDLKRKQAHNKKKYEGSSLSERYASHNDYVGFRKIVHDARHPGEDAPPLPHASTWFPANANGSLDTSFTGAIVSGHDEDEDFQIAGEKISIKCPITYLPMVEPVQSKQCSHNYEKKAILNMISKSEDRGAVEGRRGTTQKRIQCPECDKVICYPLEYCRPLLMLRSI